MELGVGRGLHWSAFYGFTPVKAGDTAVLKSPDGAFDREFGCLECAVGPARLLTLAGSPPGRRHVATPVAHRERSRVCLGGGTQVHALFRWDCPGSPDILTRPPG